jgi:hypothetical protein
MVLRLFGQSSRPAQRLAMREEHVRNSKARD